MLQLAAHLGSPEQARALYVLTFACGGSRTRSSARGSTRLLELVEAALAHPELTSRAATNTIEQRRNAAARLTDDRAVAARLAIAPRAYVLSQTPEALARQAALCEPPISGRRGASGGRRPTRRDGGASRSWPSIASACCHGRRRR